MNRTITETTRQLCEALHSYLAEIETLSVSDKVLALEELARDYRESNTGWLVKL